MFEKRFKEMVDLEPITVVNNRPGRRSPKILVRKKTLAIPSGIRAECQRLKRQGPTYLFPKN